MRALANEVAKNLVLAGISSLTIVDDQLVSEDDLGAQFFISEAHIGMNVCVLLLLFQPSLTNGF
jgi:ubiquitin-like 1-activating enzyme E1 A